MSTSSSSRFSRASSETSRSAASFGCPSLALRESPYQQVKTSLIKLLNPANFLLTTFRNLAFNSWPHPSFWGLHTELRTPRPPLWTLPTSQFLPQNCTRPVHHLLQVTQVIITRPSFRWLRHRLDRCPQLSFLPSVSRSSLVSTPIMTSISMNTKWKGRSSNSCLSQCLLKIHSRHLCVIVSAALVSKVLRNDFSGVWLPQARPTSNSWLWWVESILGTSRWAIH